MKKTVLVPVVVLAVLFVGMQLANRHAAKVIEAQIAEANVSYAEMAEHGALPALQLGYRKVSANVLRARYRIEGIRIELGEFGPLFAIEQLQLRGIQPNRLSTQGELKVDSLTLGSGAAQLLTPELSELMSGLVVHGDYRYRYQEQDGRLTLDQQTRINQEFLFGYQLQFTGLQALWQQLELITTMSADEQQALLESEQGIASFTAALLQGALNQGEFRIENMGFIQRLTTQAAAQGQTPDFSVLQGMALMLLSTAEGLPVAWRQSLIAFVQEPISLTLAFQFQQPLRFAELETGTAFANIESLEALADFAGIRLSVNDQ